MEGFARRIPVVVQVKGGKKNRMLLLNELKHEDGSGHKFIFVTAMKGLTGYYDTQKRKGFIKV